MSVAYVCASGTYRLVLLAVKPHGAASAEEVESEVAASLSTSPTTRRRTRLCPRMAGWMRTQGHCRGAEKPFAGTPASPTRSTKAERPGCQHRPIHGNFRCKESTHVRAGSSRQAGPRHRPPPPRAPPALLALIVSSQGGEADDWEVDSLQKRPSVDVCGHYARIVRH
jgi:hypothetical protein